MEKNTAKLLVRIISVLGFIAAVLVMVYGIAFVSSGANPKIEVEVLGTIATITLTIFEFIVALNLWRYKNWARITGIILMVLGIITYIAAIIPHFGAVTLSNLSAIIRIIIPLAIVGCMIYLLAFNKEIVSLFK